FLDVDRLRALIARLLLVGDLRALGQRAEAAARNRGVMDEKVAAAVIRRDEAVSLLVVEPLDRSGRHVNAPFLRLPGALLRTRTSGTTCISFRPAYPA